MKVAVVGAGIFGITVSIRLSSQHEVHLFEKNDSILSAASRANQLRLHRGYHYPRSPETVRELSYSYSKFVEEYREAIVCDYDHFYCIAKDMSLVTGQEYVDFCKTHNLNYEIIDNLNDINNDLIDVVIRANENIIDYHELFDICTRRLNSSKVHLHLGTEFHKSKFDAFDVVVNCTYSSTNNLIPKTSQSNYQFELCEKILVRPPKTLIGKSIVIMDGPFMCIDPYGKTEYSLLGNVVHAIHESSIGKKPKFSRELTSLTDIGLVKERKFSKFNDFIESGKKYIRDLEKCEYVGSFYTIRTVLPRLEATDARPTIVSRNNDKLITVFSGKIDTCSNAADSVYNLLENQ